MERPIFIVKAGTTYPEIARVHGDFDDWILRCISPEKRIYCEIISLDSRYPDPADMAAVIVSGSHSMVTTPSSEERRLATWLKNVLDKNVAVLGICYGHQLVAEVLGGEVGYLSGGPEFGVIRVECAPEAESDWLCGIYPMHFEAFAAHWQTVRRLPYGAVSLGRSLRDRHQMVRYRDWVWGVQFHPEFTADILKQYLFFERDSLESSDELEQILARLEQPNAADPLIERFCDLVLAHRS